MFPSCKPIKREGEDSESVGSFHRPLKEGKKWKFDVYDITAAAGNAGTVYLDQ